MRKLATIRKIDSIGPIEGADAIEVAQVGGWKVVIKKNEFKVGDLAVYFEIDSWIPDHLAPFLSKGHAPRVFNGVPGERLRTVKLRGQVSQGLLLPMFILTNYGADLVEGSDVSDTLNIQKYEPPVSAQLAGQVSGGFPSFIPKTDQERIQNLSREFKEWKAAGYTWTESEKCDGSSFTAYFHDGKFGICSRNWELLESKENTLWNTAAKYNLREKLTMSGRNLAIQAELLGPGIQGNIYKLTNHMLAVFDVFDIDKQEYLIPKEKKEIIEGFGLESVPILTSTRSFNAMSVQEVLKLAEGKSIVGGAGPEREGLVFNCNETRISFKAISNSFLLRQK